MTFSCPTASHLLPPLQGEPGLNGPYNTMGSPQTGNRVRHYCAVPRLYWLSPADKFTTDSSPVRRKMFSRFIQQLLPSSPQVLRHSIKVLCLVNSYREEYKN